LLGKGDLERCHQVCIDLINAPKLPVDLKIETIQIMCTLVPLEQARFFLEDALRLASDMVKAEPGNLLWLGLLTTTRDQIWKIYKIKGAIMFHREITFGNPIAGKLLFYKFTSHSSAFDNLQGYESLRKRLLWRLVLGS
jgi:hypothetical protein